MLLGRIYGSVTTKRFSFKAEVRIKKLQYVAVKDFEGKWVLARIDSVIKYTKFTVAKVHIIGYRDNRGFLKAPSVPFEPGTPVFTADVDLIKNVLGLNDSGLYIGLLSGYKIHVNLPIKHLISKHVAILAKTGTGKSYSAGVLLEELAENNIPVVIIDPHGEYSSLSKPNNKNEEIRLMETFGIEPKSYEKQVKIFDIKKQGPLRLNSKLSANEIINMLPTKISSAQKGLLYSAIKNLEGRMYTLRDIIDEISSIESQSKWGLVSLLETLENTKLFSNNPTKSSELVKYKQITIIDLKDAQPEIQQIAVMKLIEELFKDRKCGNIPEFFLVIEEAHNFCPERGFGETASSKIIRSVASEGRKFGLGLCIISQRPAKIDKNVLSQCNTQIILKVTNPNDLKAIIDSVEGVTSGTKDEIKDLPVGMALVVGATEQPLLVDVRVRRSEHGGERIIGENSIPEINNEILSFEPKYSDKDIKKEYKGVDLIEFLNYPMWKATGLYKNFEITFYVDGIMGEIVFKHKDAIETTKGTRVLTDLPPSQRSIMLHLIRNRFSTIENMASSLNMPVSAVKVNVRNLLDKKYIITDGYVFRNNFPINMPTSTDGLGIDYNVTKRSISGLTIDFMVSSDFTRKIGDLLGVKVLSAERVYMPFWVVTHKNRKFLINALNNKLDLQRSKAIIELV